MLTHRTAGRHCITMWSSGTYKVYHTHTGRNIVLRKLAQAFKWSSQKIVQTQNSTPWFWTD